MICLTSSNDLMRWTMVLVVAPAQLCAHSHAISSQYYASGELPPALSLGRFITCGTSNPRDSRITSIDGFSLLGGGD